MTEIAARHVLVTGGASGIGRLVAHQMAALGGRVSVWDIQREALGRVISELEKIGAEPARGFVCDVSRRAEVYRVAEETAEACGPVDILVNDAGVVSGCLLLELPDEKIEATFATNALSLFWTTKAFLPAMVERGRGHLVTIASASSLIGVARLSDYAASKWAAMGFDESLRAELRKTAPALRTTIVCPY
jgi:all-trans-retinol dehydrogenase (NAD+)